MAAPLRRPSTLAMIARELRDELLAVVRRLLPSGLVSGTSGNVSGRTANAGQILVTPSGVDYDAIDEHDLVEVDLEGRVIDGRLMPSTDTMGHLAIYRARRDVGGVVHTHSPYATAFAIVGQPIPAVHIEAAGYLGGAVRVIDYVPPASPELADRLASGLANDRAVLLPNHGVVAVGGSPRQALQAAQIVEDAARVAWLARVLGEPRPVAEREIDRLHEFMHGRYGQRRA
jgi:ribulose-5-phosphate 4-epimerase/fuculose-1-phosphate aldolase